jgi:hypothetical protein
MPVWKSAGDWHGYADEQLGDASLRRLVRLRPLEILLCTGICPKFEAMRPRR